MIDRFAQALSDLGVQLDLTLHIDKNGACKLNIEDKLFVQLESDPQQKNIILLSFLGEVPAGKPREMILRDALKTNYPYPAFGTLAYSDKNNQLTLFATLPFETTRGVAISNFLASFIEKAELWKKAIETGQTGSLAPASTKTTTNPYGMK